ncbi:MAG: metallophosphoesterase [bacterium]
MTRGGGLQAARSWIGGLGLAAVLAACGASARKFIGPLPPVAPVSAAQPFTFAVIGDNRPAMPKWKKRGGMEHPRWRDEALLPHSTAYRQIIREINEARPSFVLHTGDMILGYVHKFEDTSRAAWVLRKEFEGFKAATPLVVPLYPAPGNHDALDTLAARIYTQEIGPLHYAFTWGNSRFIALDSNAGGKARHRVDPDQRAWLAGALAASSGTARHVFVYLHEPLFPVLAPTPTNYHGHIGSSLDAHPAERDELHTLFVRYGGRAVFAGHEHLYNRQEKDGVTYFIVGGAGGEVYKELGEAGGGFDHYLMVTVEGDTVTYQVKRPAPWTP